MKIRSITLVFLCLMLSFILALSACDDIDDEDNDALEETQSPGLYFMIDDDIYLYNKSNSNEDEDNTFSLPSAAPEKEGYSFDGWYTDKDVWSNEVDEAMLSEIDASIATEIHAKFTPISYTIKYDFDKNATLENAPQTYTVEDKITLVEPVLPGYRFDGWFNGETKVTEIDTGSVGDISLTAKFSFAEYTITYEIEGVDVKNTKNPKSYNINSKTLKLVNPTAQGYQFKGWYIGEEKITEIKAGSWGDLTITAKLVPIEYDINYIIDKKATNPNPKDYTVESSVTLVAPTLEGYEFDGWYDGNKKITKFADGSRGDRTLTAVWKQTYTINFNAGDGSGTMASLSYKYGQNVTLPMNIFSRSNYVFAGWKDNKGKVYTNCDEISYQPSNGSSVTLTAQWKSGLGFDISSYQAGINFDTLKAQNIGFLILRGGYTGWGTGENYNKDDSFETFYAQAKQRNIPVGVYWYSCANSTARGKAEAEFLYENCLKGKTFELPIFIDVENKQWQGAGSDGKPGGTVEGVTAGINAFCDYMFSKNMYPAVYTYVSFCGYMDINQISAKYDIWIAGYVSQNYIDTHYTYGDYEMWQFTDSYSSSLSIDTNYLYKDYETFIKRFGFNGFKATDADAEFKTYEELAREVMAGKWGSGDNRKQKLTQAGYDYQAVQDAVDWLS